MKTYSANTLPGTSIRPLTKLSGKTRLVVPVFIGEDCEWPVQVQKEEGQKSDQTSGNASAGEQKRRSRVLIVDNSPVMRKIISDVFVALPHMEVVGQAKDGVEALESIERLKPDLVVLDIQMPRMSGLEVLKRIPQGRCRVIMLSAHADEFYIEKCRQLNADYFFDKLANFHQFVECVATL